MTNLLLRTILLVEDNPAAVLLVKRAFAKGQISCDLQVVADGCEALRYLDGEEPYADRTRYPLPVLVMSNIKMPNLSGFELLAWIRQHPNYKRLPVVIISSSELEIDNNRAFELGANSYLIKPISVNALLGMLQALELDFFSLDSEGR
ncbi:response regulator [Gloeobacter kilaueensis]|uniref:Response regulator receiver protein n=1 Tax=Gloeobacter kilaueensis (strain ATCC BAA-2537 / CCAP 1431/1 / ULC 316 / JS1) TaxID=1183438 RepID=U5QHS3_GLOK1|nr:response regulator [Gloeobacter kilaueensis]AGY57179.1 response regulator receiver protein [Gloeobacter kilaueensis JS1]